MTMPGFSQKFRRRPWPEDEQGFPAPPDGPDVQPQAPFVPQFVQPQMMRGDPGAGQGLGQLASLGAAWGANKLLTRTPAPHGQAQSGTGGKFLGKFAQGGTLRKPGDTAVVGDAGPELAVEGAGGQTQIIPFKFLRGYGDDSQTQAGGVGGVSFMQNYGAQDSPTADGQSAVRPRTVSPPYEPPTVPMAGRVGAQPAPGEEDANDSKFVAALRRVGFRPDAPPAGEQGAGAPVSDERRPWVVDRLGYDETHAPNNHNGRFKSALVAAGLGALRGAVSNPQNPLGGALGGAAGAGLVGAVRPQTDEEMRQSMFTLPRERAERAAAVAAQEARLKQAGEVADVGLKTANATKARADAYRSLNPLPKPPQVIARRDGVYLRDDSGNITKTNIPPEKVNNKTEWIDGVLHSYDDDNVPHPVINPDTKQPIIDPTKVPVTENGLTVTPGQALNYRGQIEGEKVRAANEDAAQSTREANERAMRQWESDVADWRDAGGKAEEYNKSWRALKQNMGDIKAMQSQPNFSQSDEKFQQLLEDNRRLSSEVEAAQPTLRSRYAKHVRFLDSGYAEAGPQPARPDVISQPTRQVRGARRSGNGVPGATPQNVQSVIDRIRGRN